MTDNTKRKPEGSKGRRQRDDQLVSTIDASKRLTLQPEDPTIGGRNGTQDNQTLLDEESEAEEEFLQTLSAQEKRKLYKKLKRELKAERALSQMQDIVFTTLSSEARLAKEHRRERSRSSSPRRKRSRHSKNIATVTNNEMSSLK